MTNYITSCGKCGRDIESLGPPLIWSDQHGHICYGCHTESGPPLKEVGIFEAQPMIAVVTQGGQNSKICGGEELKDMLPASHLCQMVFVAHPDSDKDDEVCSRPSVGRTEDKVYVCEKCAVNSLKEGFTVHPLDYVFKK